MNGCGCCNKTFLIKTGSRPQFATLNLDSSMCVCPATVFWGGGGDSFPCVKSGWVWVHFVTNQSTSISQNGLGVMSSHLGSHSLVGEARSVYKNEVNANLATEYQSGCYKF